MSGYLEEVINSKDYNNYKLTADKVIEKLDGVREERTKSRRRWIWELMQNAKDVPNKYEMVSIEINLAEDLFQFKHNGDPFQVGNITGLIQQVSFGKPSNNSNRRITGKFGTGFITTHLLSDVVEVEGVVEKEPLPPKKFKIRLNRKGETSEDLIPAIKTELEKLNEIEKFEPLDEYHIKRDEIDKPTIFSYPLQDEESKKAAIIGVEDLANTLPQTLIFVNDQLKAVSVNDSINGQKIKYERVRFDEIECFNENEVIIYATVIKETNGDAEEFNFIVFRNEEIDLAIRVSDFETKKVLINEKSPRLFRDFPLVGSEKFQFPFLLNGTKFHPTEKRDNILLEGNENKPTTNRRIVEYTIDKVKIFVEWLIKKEAQNLSSIANSRIPESISEESVEKWYKTNIQKNYRNFLLQQPIVETGNGNLSLQSAIIPKVSGSNEVNEEFWEIVSEFYGKDRLCRKEHLKNWHKYIGPSDEIDTWEDDIYFTLEDLLKQIQVNKKLDEIKIKGDLSNIEWLNKVYSFIIKLKQTDFFNAYKIFPTISGILKSFDDDLFVEEVNEIPDHFISIYKKLNSDWNDILIHRGIINIDSSRASKSTKDISTEINKILNYEEKNSLGVTQKFFFENEHAESVLIEIIRVFSIANSQSFQAKLFDLAKRFFNYNESEKIISNIEDFNFNPAIRQLIKLLNRSIEKSEDLNKICSTNSASWLNEYLILLQNNTEFKSFLEFGNIVPNRKDELCSINEVKSYGTEETPLDDVLISILFDFNSEEDWNKILVHDLFRELDLKNKKLDELANKIQDELERLRINNQFSNKSNSILKLNKWCAENPILAQTYFKPFLGEKDKILVNISLEDEKVGGNIVKLLSDKDKLDDLVSISESGVNLSHLSEIAEIAKSISIEEIRDLAQQLKDEKEDFEFKKKIGNEIEKAFIETFNSLNLPYEITYQGIGSQDVIIYNPINQRSFYIELKSLSPNRLDKSINLSISQARKAVEQIDEDNYIVSVLIRPNHWEDASIEFIKRNLRSQFAIGTLLKQVVNKNRQFEELLSYTNEIDLAFVDTRRKVKVSEMIWRTNGQSFDELIHKLKMYLD
ncbi:sacsin N-terminal ATP-binding-like domain-containing protein [Marinifilum flexuosum]|uniref:Uncharacterized protein n=1 Tax=Marinifilum flexuosum TaxID=1117708 RepID=A0A419X9Q3_9BACT|nr:hypothetical protein [Marinifilum flexuosum]RKE04445.1 hypothetical protein BXY64_1465 [Marinifilum flexuosum]